MTALDQINKIAHKLPFEVVQDIDKRVDDCFLWWGKLYKKYKCSECFYEELEGVE